MGDAGRLGEGASTREKLQTADRDPPQENHNTRQPSSHLKH